MAKNIVGLIASQLLVVTALLTAIAGMGTAVAEQSTGPIRLPDSSANWQATARADIDAAYQELLNNHPGVYDASNPGFMPQLEHARLAALALTDRVNDVTGYLAILSVFTAGLHDGHAGLYGNLGDQQGPATRWPGFITVWRGDGLYVQESDDNALPRGAKVIDCDGLAIRDLILKNVFAYGGRSEEAGQWWSRAYRVFVDDSGNPFVAWPKQCRFASRGQTIDYKLNWKLADPNLFAALRLARLGDRLSVGLTEPRPGLLWVAMPTFTPEEADRNAYFAMDKEVQTNRQRVLRSDAVVIDLRYNQGGSSTWSRDFAKALWGDARVERALDAYSSKDETWWRASQDNTDFVLSLVTRFREQKLQDNLEWAVKNGSGMLAALHKGDKYYVERDPAVALSGHGLTSRYGADVAEFTKPVYVIVPGDCASACLDALDVFTRFANTKLIGAPSSADTTYMDVRLKVLPSGLAKVVIPNKMYVNRPRAAGQIYEPAIEIRDLDWSTVNLQKAVERELAAAQHGKSS